ncbi:MAG: sodium:solute symporter [Blastocatellia bacterium]|nr:sodium:solute symporter [Blastocatellia bacterium]
MHLPLASGLSTPDYVVIAVYFLIIFGIGLYFSLKERNTSEYFLAGKHLGWFVIGGSLFVSNISTEHFIGLAGSGAASGLAVGHYEWLACFMLLILGWVFVPFYLRNNVFTMPEFLERRYNRAASNYLTGISILAYIFTKISVHLYAAAIVLKEVAGWDPLTASVILIVATGVYTVAGGFEAVVYTDLVQTLILVFGAVVLTVLGMQQVGGFEGLRAALPADHFHMIAGKGPDHPDFPWTGIFFGAPILGIWYWCTDQVIVQRVLAAKDEGNAKMGTIFAGFLKVLPVFILVMPGMIAFALFKSKFPLKADGTTNFDAAYILMIENLLSPGLKGLMVAALLAALMGAMSAVFNSSSTLLTIDVYKRMKPQASEKELVNFGRIATAVLVILGLAWVPLLNKMTNQLFLYLQAVQAYVSPPIAVCFVFGILSPRFTGSGAVASLLTGFVMGATRFILEVVDKSTPFAPGSAIHSFLKINFLHYAVIMFVVCALVLVVVSLLGPAPDREKLKNLTFATTDKKPSDDPHTYETPFWHRVNVGASMVLGGLVVGLWIYFY